MQIFVLMDPKPFVENLHTCTTKSLNAFELNKLNKLNVYEYKALTTLHTSFLNPSYVLMQVSNLSLSIFLPFYQI